MPLFIAASFITLKIPVREFKLDRLSKRQKLPIKIFESVNVSTDYKLKFTFRVSVQNCPETWVNSIEVYVQISSSDRR